VSSYNITDATQAFKEAYSRDYPLWYVSFVKYRQLHETKFKDAYQALALYRKYKKKYKSAQFIFSPPPILAWREAFNAPNRLLAKLKKNSDFVGEPIAVPIPFGKR